MSDIDSESLNKAGTVLLSGGGLGALVIYSLRVLTRILSKEKVDFTKDRTEESILTQLRTELDRHSGEITKLYATNALLEAKIAKLEFRYHRMQSEALQAYTLMSDTTTNSKQQVLTILSNIIKGEADEANK